MRNALLFLSLTFSLLVCAQPAEQAQALYERALTAAKAGRLDSALVQVEQVLALNPSHGAGYKLRGDLHQREGRSEAALADYRKSEELAPNNARLYISRSALRISQGQHKTALKDCNTAIQLDPTDPDGYYNRGCALYLGGNIEGAKKDAEKAVKLKPDHADALYLSGVTKGELYQEEDALADIDAALKLKPTIPGGLMSMAVILYEGKHYEEAVERFTEVLATDTAERAAAHFYRGDCWYELDNKEKACEDYLIAMRMGDKDAVFIKKNYCDTDLKRIPKKPVKKKRKNMIEF